MTAAPEEMNFLVIDDLFIHYNLLCDDGEELLYVECERCDDIIAVFRYDAIMKMEELELYKTIIKAHGNV